MAFLKTTFLLSYLPGFSRSAAHCGVCRAPIEPAPRPAMKARMITLIRRLKIIRFKVVAITCVSCAVAIGVACQGTAHFVGRLTQAAGTAPDGGATGTTGAPGAPGVTRRADLHGSRPAMPAATGA